MLAYKSNIKTIENVIFSLIDFLEDVHYKSYDPFDALLSPAIIRLCGNSNILKRISVQVIKNFPFNTRSLLGYNPKVHTKTLSDMLSVYSKLYAMNRDKEYLVKSQNLYKMLVERSIKIDGIHSWGLDFPYSSRFVNSTENTPNLYNTIHSADALLDYYLISDEEEIIDLLMGIKKFMFEKLGYVRLGNSEGWLRYYPNQTIPTYNVNALAASFLVRVNKILNQDIVPHIYIDGLLNFLINNQNSDGSWYYSLSEDGKWIDGFHTGFILDSLLSIEKNHYKYDLKLPIEKGLSFYIENLFDSKRIPKYYHDKVHPIDSQNCAQAIQTLCISFKNGKNINRDFIINVVDAIINVLYDERGFIYYKKSKFILNKQFYARWSQTPMILALLALINMEK